MLTETAPQTFVTTVRSDQLDVSSPYLLRSYATPPTGQEAPPRHHKWTIVEAVLAATAGQPFSPPVEVGGWTFQDSTTALDPTSANPARIAEGEAARIRAFDTLPIKILLTLGNGIKSIAGPQQGARVNDWLTGQVVALRPSITDKEQLDKALTYFSNVVEGIRNVEQQMASKYAKCALLPPVYYAVLVLMLTVTVRRCPNTMFRFDPIFTRDGSDLADHLRPTATDQAVMSYIAHQLPLVDGFRDAAVRTRSLFDLRPLISDRASIQSQAVMIETKQRHDSL